VTERCHEGVWDVRSCHSAPEESKKKRLWEGKREKDGERVSRKVRWCVSSGV